MTNQKHLFSLDHHGNARAAEDARDAALDRVAEHSDDFMTLGLRRIASLPAGEYTGEQIRHVLTGRGINPNHVNAWGALISTAVRRELLIETGRYVKMTDKKSHARRTAVYVTSKGNADG